jgi:hypothetical protein
MRSCGYSIRPRVTRCKFVRYSCGVAAGSLVVEEPSSVVLVRDFLLLLGLALVSLSDFDFVEGEEVVSSLALPALMSA